LPVSKRTSVRNRNGSLQFQGYSYNNAGDLETETGGVTTSYDFDDMGRLVTLSHDLAGSEDDVTFSLAYNPASQLVSTDI